MRSDRTLNILRAAARQYPDGLRHLLKACAKASSYDEREVACDVLKQLLNPPGHSLAFRTDLGDEFQSKVDRKFERSVRKTNTMINNCMRLVKDHAEAGTMHNLINQLGIHKNVRRSLAQPTQDAPSQRSLNETVSILLGGLSATLHIDQSPDGMLGIVIIKNENQQNSYPFNSDEDFFSDRAKRAQDFASQLPRSHILCGLPLVFRGATGQVIPA
jgi:hypothetical protein